MKINFTKIKILDMKKKIDSLLNEQSQLTTTNSILGKFRVVLMGKDFQPMPAYWALIPIGQDNIMKIKKKG